MPEPDNKGRRPPADEPADAGASRPTVLVAFRVPAALAERLEALAAKLSTPWHEMSRSAAARAALERGLDAFEQDTAAQGKEGGGGGPA